MRYLRLQKKTLLNKYSKKAHAHRQHDDDDHREQLPHTLDSELYGEILTQPMCILLFFSMPVRRCNIVIDAQSDVTDCSTAPFANGNEIWIGEVAIRGTWPTVTSDRINFDRRRWHSYLPFAGD